jgi:hypothetical protein
MISEAISVTFEFTIQHYVEYFKKWKEIFVFKFFKVSALRECIAGRQLFPLFIYIFNQARIFCDFWQFLAKGIFLEKPMLRSNFLNNLALFWAQNAKTIGPRLTQSYG